MKCTTLCYIENDSKYLMLYRNKKKNDPNAGKFIGIGGKIEKDEAPDECLIREVHEETNLHLSQYDLRGVIHFISDTWEDELMYLYTAVSDNLQEIKPCDEGDLYWVDKTDIMDYPLWEGDIIFLKLLQNDSPYFELTLRYEGDNLVESKIN